MASAFEKEFEQACLDGALPGAVLCATNVDGSFTYAKAFKGRGQGGEGPIDNNYNLDSEFFLASCTKLITTVAALQCADKGLIGLDDDVSRWLPELGELKILLEYEDGKEPVFEDVKSPITLRRLLTHTAGFAMGILEPHIKRYREHNGQNIFSIMAAGTVREKYYCPLQAQPGTLWSYNSGHDWASKVIEKVTGTTLEDWIREHICPPLGASSITFWAKKHPDLEGKLLQASKRGKNAQILKGTALGLPPDDDEAPLFPATGFADVKYEECFGGEGLHASMPDYLKVLHSLLANDEKLLKKETVKQMFTPQFSQAVHQQFNAMWHAVEFSELTPGEYPPQQELDWGLGAMITTNDDPDGRAKGTLMWSGALNLFWFISPERGLCGIFGTQVQPSGDNKAKKLMTMWEREMYRLAAAAEKKSA